MTVNGKWSLTAVHGLNKYLWDVLKDELEWSATDYGGLTPITIPQQQPEFNNYNAPYVVYNYSHQSSGDDFMIQEEQVAYVIYSADEGDIRKFVNVVREYFDHRDESAKKINDWIRVNGTSENKRFDYKFTYVISTTGAQPAISEGGKMDGLVIMRICYTYYDPTTGKDRLSI